MSSGEFPAGLKPEQQLRLRLVLRLLEIPGAPPSSIVAYAGEFADFVLGRTPRPTLLVTLRVRPRTDPEEPDLA